MEVASAAASAARADSMDDTWFWRSVKRLSVPLTFGTRPAAVVIWRARDADTERIEELLGGALVALAILDAVVDFVNSGGFGIVKEGSCCGTTFFRISRRGWPWIGLIAPTAGNLSGCSSSSFIVYVALRFCKAVLLDC